MLTIDGSAGEGGGQILRTSLGLSMVTGQPFCIERIRAGRQKPGILRQHLTAIQAAAEICSAATEGAAIGSRDLSFRPGTVKAGDYSFAIGTAGSTTLVLQTVLPALLLADAPSRLTLEGGTHNPMAPPFDFLERAFLPLLARMGATVAVSLERPGFYPAGGGSLRVSVEGRAKLAGIELCQRGPILETRARASVAMLPATIADRELAVLKTQLRLSSSDCEARELRGSRGPGNAVTVDVRSEPLTEVFTGFGAKGITAESVAEGVAREVRAYVASEAPVGPHLADQLLVPMALARSGRLRTGAPTPHTTTNVDVIRRFADVSIEVAERGAQWEVTVGEGRRSSGWPSSSAAPSPRVPVT